MRSRPTEALRAPLLLQYPRSKDLIDLEGTVLREEAQARSDAIDLAGRSIAEMGADFWTYEGERLLEVCSETGAALFALKFAAVDLPPHGLPGETASHGREG